MNALALPALYKAVAVLRTFFPKLDGRWVNLVAVLAGLGVSWVGVNFYPEAPEVWDKILSGLTIGFGSSAVDVGVKALDRGYVTYGSE